MRGGFSPDTRKTTHDQENADHRADRSGSRTHELKHHEHCSCPGLLLERHHRFPVGSGRWHVLSRDSSLATGLRVATAVTLVVVTIGCARTSTGEISTDVRAAITALATMPPELEIAAQKVKVECLRKAGFDVPFSPTVPESSMASISGVVGIRPSEEQSRQQGYPSTLQPASGAEDLETYMLGLPQEEAERFHRAEVGPPHAPKVTITSTSGATAEQSAVGCHAEGQARVFGSVKASLEVSMLGNELLTATSGSAVTDAVRSRLPDYESCMRERGYPVEGLHADALAAKRFGAYRVAGQPPSPDEASMAAQDSRCQSQSGIIEAQEQAFLESAAPWIVAHEDLILTRKAQLDAALTNAREVLEE